MKIKNLIAYGVVIGVVASGSFSLIESEKANAVDSMSNIGEATFYSFEGKGDSETFPKKGFKLSDSSLFQVVEKGNSVEVTAKSDGPGEARVTYINDSGKEVQSVLRFDESHVNLGTEAESKDSWNIVSDNSITVGMFDSDGDSDSIVFEALHDKYSINVSFMGNIKRANLNIYTQTGDGDWEYCYGYQEDEEGNEAEVNYTWYFDVDYDFTAGMWSEGLSDIRLEKGKTYAITIYNDIYNGIGSQYSIDLTPQRW